MRKCMGWQLVGQVMWLFLSQGRIIYFAAQRLHTFRNVVNRGPIYERVVPFYSSVGPIEHNMW